MKAAMTLKVNQPILTRPNVPVGSTLVREGWAQPAPRRYVHAFQVVDADQKEIGQADFSPALLTYCLERHYVEVISPSAG